jgi:hypothetical protein
MRDPAFGPVILVGSGGTDVETIQDVAVLLPPISPDDIREAIARLELARRLAARRGAPAGDVDALVAVVLAVQNLMTDPAQGILSIDLNPVLVGPIGRGCVAVDAVVERLARPLKGTVWLP